MSEFDKACAVFTIAMQKAANWKHEYGGSVYTTRLVMAIVDARHACDKLENELRRLGEIK